ncbi:hypothetical protein L7F22_047320 [Adiantum nelumboides]|nr:hypothetical protein [Adiantum nelumboides]
MDSGVRFWQLLDGVAPFSLGLGAASLWVGVSIASMISTGTHKSSFKGKSGVVHDYLVDLRIVIPAIEAEGYAKVLDLSETVEGLNGANMSLGVLEVISKVYTSMQLEL